MFTSRILCAARSTRGALSRRYATGTTHHVNENNVKGGLKATLHNPRVSEAAKQRAAERLDEFDNGSGAARSSQPIGQREHHASEDTGPSKTVCTLYIRALGT
ncbi:hypothetical protein C8Q77DRAFT_822663 [Trametes polyzona]|nr:hypothetical protein C8Q77DRAFT_822663 [Trametes polyzona]